MKKTILTKLSLLVMTTFFLSSCSLLGNSGQSNTQFEQEMEQDKMEMQVRNHITSIFLDYGLYQNYTFTNFTKQKTIYHKRLEELYDAKYNLNQIGVLMGDTVRKLNREIDTLVPFIEKNNYKVLYKTEHLFGFEQDSTLKLIRGEFFLTKNRIVDSTSIQFVHTIPNKMKTAYNHFIYKKPYLYHPNSRTTSEETDFYNNFHRELWNRRDKDGLEEEKFLDHTLLILNQMINQKEFDLKHLTEFQIKTYLSNSNYYNNVENLNLSEVFYEEIDKNDAIRRKIYERNVNFYYLLDGKKIKEEMIFQFNDFLEIIN